MIGDSFKTERYSAFEMEMFPRVDAVTLSCLLAVVGRWSLDCHHVQRVGRRPHLR